MKKRFLQVCKNPTCNKEFAILHDKTGEIRFRCPHCKKLQKVVLPVKKKKKARKR